MPSPFPGMDPYLEASSLWAAFRHHLVTCLYQSLLPGLVDRYRARVGQPPAATYNCRTDLLVGRDHCHAKAGLWPPARQSEKANKIYVL